jgi:hypothetical protein
MMPGLAPGIMFCGASERKTWMGSSGYFTGAVI